MSHHANNHPFCTQGPAWSAAWSTSCRQPVVHHKACDLRIRTLCRSQGTLFRKVVPDECNWQLWPVGACGPATVPNLVLRLHHALLGGTCKRILTSFHALLGAPKVVKLTLVKAQAAHWKRLLEDEKKYSWREDGNLIHEYGRANDSLDCDCDCDAAVGQAAMHKYSPLSIRRALVPCDERSASQQEMRAATYYIQLGVVHWPLIKKEIRVYVYVEIWVCLGLYICKVYERKLLSRILFTIVIITVFNRLALAILEVLALRSSHLNLCTRARGFYINTVYPNPKR